MATREKLPCAKCRHSYWDHDYDEATTLLRCTTPECQCDQYERPL